MIFLTGDTHGSVYFQKLKNFAEENVGLTKDDYVVIAGDFGGVWSAATLENDLASYEALPFTVLFIDGNNENFDLLNKYPVSEWNGGKVHFVKPDIIHLMRGQIFDLDGKSVFTFGGGTSFDKLRRKEGESWWFREIPSYKEFDEGLSNLKKRGNKVDIIITHSIDEGALYYPPLMQRLGGVHSYPENQMLRNFEDIVKYGHWYFGHYHIDAKITDKKTALFKDFIRIA